MTTTQNTELAQFQDILRSGNYYYFRNTEGSQPFSKKRDEAGNPCAALRDYGSLMFSDVLSNGAPSAVIVDIQREDDVRGNPEIAIVFGNGSTLVGLMCEVRSGTYDKVALAISRNPALLEKVFSAFDGGTASNVSIPRNTMIYRQSTNITFNEDTKRLELIRYKK